jgi:hypothetical protein
MESELLGDTSKGAEIKETRVGSLGLVVVLWKTTQAQRAA